jgi:hypothetical protein
MPDFKVYLKEKDGAVPVKADSVELDNIYLNLQEGK